MFYKNILGIQDFQLQAVGIFWIRVNPKDGRLFAGFRRDGRIVLISNFSEEIELNNNSFWKGNLTERVNCSILVPIKKISYELVVKNFGDSIGLQEKVEEIILRQEIISLSDILVKAKKSWGYPSIKMAAYKTIEYTIMSKISNWISDEKLIPAFQAFDNYYNSCQKNN